MGNMDCGDGLLKLTTVTEPEFPEVTEVLGHHLGPKELGDWALLLPTFGH